MQFDFIKPIENIFPICPLFYAESMLKFHDLKRSGKIKNMLDYLVIYNEVDTVILSKGFTKMIETFNNLFDINLLEYESKVPDKTSLIVIDNN